MTPPGGARGRIRELRAMWCDLQDEWPELRGWTFNINARMTSNLGRCDFGPQKIHVARWVAEDASWDQAADTLLHEAAHALAGPGHGHDRWWKDVAAMIGARPERCAPSHEWAAHAPAADRGPKWRIRCRDCGGLLGERKQLQGRLRTACLKGTRHYTSSCCRAGVAAEEIR